MNVLPNIMRWLVLGLVLGATFLRAEPLNVLINDLTFTRPPAWQWQPPSDKSKSTAVTQFVVAEKNGKPTTSVRFYAGTKDAVTVKPVWKSAFPKATDENVQEEKIKIGKQEVTYISIRGDYVSGKSTPKHHYLFIGAIVPRAVKFVHVVVLGPEAEVEACLKDFKNMVETAIKEKQAEEGN